MSTAIVWFRRDLRLQDNPALSAACQAHDRILPIYIHAPHEEGEWAAGAATRWWLHHSLSRLDAQMRRHDHPLHLATGDSLTVLREAIERSGASAVYWNRLYEPASIARDSAVKAALREQGVEDSTDSSVTRYATPAEASRLIEPRINIHTGARMLADLIRRFGHIDAALAAWNAGEGAVRRAGNRVPDIDETQAHVHLVLELYWALLQQSQPARAQRLTLHP